MDLADKSWEGRTGCFKAPADHLGLRTRWSLTVATRWSCGVGNLRAAALSMGYTHQYALMGREGHHQGVYLAGT